MSLRVSRYSWLVVVLALVCVGAARALSVDAQATPEAQAELQRFNQTMRSIYAESRAQLLAETRPIIIVGPDDITLVTSLDQQTKRYTPPLYHQLKAFSHVVLGVVGALTPWPESGDRGSRWREALGMIDARAEALLPELDRLGFEPGTRERQLRILLATRRFIESARKNGRPDRDSLRGYLEGIKPDWLANVGVAARIQLEALDAAVTGWRLRMSPEEWARLMVVVLGSRMPRVNNLQMAYFARVLGDDARGARLIYAENVFDNERALKLVGVIVIDRHVSSLVFGDPMRLDRDVLGYAAGTVLDELVPQRSR